MLDLVRKKYTSESLSYRLIAPSLPGFTVSSPPLETSHGGRQTLQESPTKQ